MEKYLLIVNSESELGLSQILLEDSSAGDNFIRRSWESLDYGTGGQGGMND